MVLCRSIGAVKLSWLRYHTLLTPEEALLEYTPAAKTLPFVEEGWAELVAAALGRLNPLDVVRVEKLRDLHLALGICSSSLTLSFHL